MNTLKTAIQAATDEAKRKYDAGKLFKSGDESPEANDFATGDPETIHTLAALYAQYVEDALYSEAEDEIEKALLAIYPEY